LFIGNINLIFEHNGTFAYNRPVMAMTIPGVEKAWEDLASCSSDEVCRKAMAEFEQESGTYTLMSFGRHFTIQSGKKSIESLDEGGELFLGKLGYFFKLSVLWYLVKAADINPSGQLVNPSGLPGGDIFFRGTHVLPLNAVAGNYAQDKEGFIKKGIELGGKVVGYGDAAIELFPLPKIPVTIILWLQDEEFPPRADLLFDETGISHIPLDILWSVAMMSVLAFL
jgi:hypothetical protein